MPAKLDVSYNDVVTALPFLILDPQYGVSDTPLVSQTTPLFITVVTAMSNGVENVIRVMRARGICILWAYYGNNSSKYDIYIYTGLSVG